jgi:hypothetical protein
MSATGAIPDLDERLLTLEDRVRYLERDLLPLVSLVSGPDEIADGNFVSWCVCFARGMR